MKIITSIGTFELFEKLTLILRGCNLSAILPRSTFTKKQRLCICSISLLAIRRQFPPPQTLHQRNPHPNTKPLESMRIATPTPKPAVSQREPRRKSADHPQFIVETYVARLWPHSGPLRRYGRTPPPTDPASATTGSRNYTSD